VAFLKKQGLQMFNKGGNLSPLKKEGKLKEKCYSWIWVCLKSIGLKKNTEGAYYFSNFREN